MLGWALWNLSCGDLEIMLVVIWLELTGLKTTGLVWGKGLVWLSVSEVFIWSGRETERLVLIFLSFAVL